MRVTRIKEDVTALSYELLRRNGISVKFRVKTYYEGLNKELNYYYKSYIYNSGNKAKSSISITPRSYIQFDFGTEDGKNMFFLSEVYKNRLVKKLSNVVKLLESYECGELIDIIKVDQSGTHIINSFPKNNKIVLGLTTMNVDVVIREEKCDIGVRISINNMSATISVFDFLDLMTKLEGLNYTNTALLLLNHMGSPELGSNEIDFRPEKIISKEDREQEFNSIASNNNSSLKNIAVKKNKSYNKPLW